VRLVGHLVPASADGSTVTDWLFVPWAATCSHTALPANQIVRIPAQDLVDGELPLRSAYVVVDPKLHSQTPFARLPAPSGATSR